jgi:hypothetical protein
MESNAPQKKSTTAFRIIGEWVQQGFSYPKTIRARRGNQIWLVCLYLAGIILLGNFLNWGNIPFDFHDWKDITAPRFTYQKNALSQDEWPLHISNKSTVGGVTDRFLTIPDLVLSPQILLLKIMDVGVFTLVNTILLYTLGFIGLGWIQRKFFLSSFAFTIAFVLFNFNGHILAHLSVGHATWGGYYLFPWFVILVFAFVEGSKNWKWVAHMAMLLFIIFIQGSYHQFVWCLFFLAFLAVTRPIKNWPALLAMVFAMLLSMVRIWPCSLSAGVFESTFHGGFGTLMDLWHAMTVIQLPAAYLHTTTFAKSLGWWELTIYIGLIGTLFLLYFGVYRWLRNRQRVFTYHELLIPILGLTILSFSVVFEWLRQIHFPLLTGERVSSRIISLPFVFILILATIEFQRWLDKQNLINWLKHSISLTVLGVIVINLWGNYQNWCILNAYQAFSHEIFTATDWYVVNRYDDWLYFQALRKGAIISVIGLLLLAGFYWVERKKEIAPHVLPPHEK